MPTPHTLYLWDMAETIFYEKWDPVVSRFPTYDDYVLSLGVDLKDARGYESAYEIPYVTGNMFSLGIMPGVQETLSWTVHNETFSTGFQKQVDWRCQYLVPRIGFDPRKYFQRLGSTFDYGETNVKTKEMLDRYLQAKYDEGYTTVVYTDDKITNCRLFQQSAKDLQAKYPDFSFRSYNVLNDNRGLRKKDGYWEIGNLLDMLSNEKKIAGE